MITKQHTQESLTQAYIHALSGVAGLNIQLGSRHDYGVDGTLRAVKVLGDRRVESGVIVDFQLKATINWRSDGANIIYDLEAKNYNDLVTREPGTPTFLLVLLCMPKDEGQWLEALEHGLTLRHCCYWTELVGPVTDNKTTKRIRIPKVNVLTPAAMSAILASERLKMVGP